MNWGSGAESTKILVVDDELSVRNSLVKWFEDDGYTVGAAADAVESFLADGIELAMNRFNGQLE